MEIAQAGGRLVKDGTLNPSEKTKDGGATWAMEFSRDGRYLAAGGHDRVVRVWAVIATRDDRRAHEREEEAAGRDGAQTRLSAPVFKPKPIYEYEGHTASILDLSWSKVCPASPIETDALLIYHPRTTSSYRRPWTRRYDCGIPAEPSVYAASSIPIS